MRIRLRRAGRGGERYARPVTAAMGLRGAAGTCLIHSKHGVMGVDVRPVGCEPCNPGVAHDRTCFELVAAVRRLVVLREPL